MLAASNLDFTHDKQFSIYVVLLMFSGLAMLIASAAAKDKTRWLDLLFGLGFLGYGFYLAFIFDGEEYFMFFYAFILPIVMIYRTIKERLEARGGGHTQPPAAQEPEAAAGEAPPAATE
jgi:hypothetical protein